MAFPETTPRSWICSHVIKKILAFPPDTAQRTQGKALKMEHHFQTPTRPTCSRPHCNLCKFSSVRNDASLRH